MLCEVLSLVLFFVPAIAVPLSTLVTVPATVLRAAPGYCWGCWGRQYTGCRHVQPIRQTRTNERELMGLSNCMMTLCVGEIEYPHVELIVTNYTG